MSKERTIITQKLCDHVKALLAGKLTHKQAAEFTGIGKATVDRIVAAGFNAEQYAKNTAARKEEKQAEKKKRVEDATLKRFRGMDELPLANNPIQTDDWHKEDDQVPGQIRMFMPEGGGTPVQLMDENKMMRFYAGQTDKIVKEINGLRNQVTGIYEMLGQILRRMDK